MTSGEEKAPADNFYNRDLSDGTAQSNRYPEPLSAGYFGVDEMSLDQLLVLGMHLAKNLKYFRLDNSESGTWKDLFVHEAAFALADIASTDTAALEKQYGVAKQSIAKQIKFIGQLAMKIDAWSRALALSDQPSITLLHAELRHIIRDQLSPRLVGVYDILSTERGEEPIAMRRRLGALGSDWGSRNASTGQVEFLQPVLASEILNVRQQQLQYIDTSFNRFLGSLVFFKNLARESLDVTLKAGDLNPALGLYIAFLKLFARAQATINDFPRKRLDFYYSQILQIEPRTRLPDAVNLSLTLAPGQPSTLVPKGTQFLAGKDANDHAILYASEEDITLTDAAVRLVRTIRFDSDPLISPANELGCVTRVLAGEHELTLDGNDGFPLFGTDASGTATEAELGFAIASPLLHLREGVRKITLDLECHNGSELPENSQAAAQQFEAIESRDEFRRLLGQVMARELMSSSAWLSPDDRDYIVDQARRVFDSESTTDEITSEVISKLLLAERTAQFYELLRGCFEVRLTAEQGWHSIDNYFIAPLPEIAGQPAIGLRIELSLVMDDPPIVAHDTEVHGREFHTGLPVISLRVNADTLFYAYSLLATLDIRAANLAVSVHDAKMLVAYNNLGRVDASKPFYPFGPLPDRDSYLTIGHYEAAKKPLTQASLRIRWGGLPRNFGGFEEYYCGYTAGFSNESFRAQSAILTNGAWLTGDSVPQQLFNTVTETGAPDEECCLDLIQSRRFSELRGNPVEADFQLDNRSRNGFFRIDLGPCDDGFGHTQYPQLLTSVLTANAKRRKPLPPPLPPYTPLINQISLDYTAESRIQFRTDSAVDTAFLRDQVFHQFPFGTHEIAQSGHEKPVPLKPRFDRDGYLLVGLTGQQLPGTVHLLFDLRDGHRQSLDQTIEYEWLYLSDNEFKTLPKDALLADTTANFTAAGIVTVELPADISQNNTIMPNGYFWLVVAARGDLSLCPRLYGVSTGALKAVRQLTTAESDEAMAPIPSGTITETVSPLAGVASIAQLGDSFGGRPAEDRTRLITRTAERLRHKDRACQPWDYERLVLERFPDLYKVKCFANMSSKQIRPAPGSVLIVVVPGAVDENTGLAQRLHVDAHQLEEIRGFLSAKAPQCANIVVRNAEYELVQVRCMIKLGRSQHPGKCLREINCVISDFISPWRPGGYGASFGWRIRRKDIEACIGALSYVEFVTDFSMLHISQDADQSYCLQDTARPEVTGVITDQAMLRDEVRPLHPWSLALPSRRHFIQTIGEIVETPAKPTGVGELEVGNTLILNTGNNHG